MRVSHASCTDLPELPGAESTSEKGITFYALGKVVETIIFFFSLLVQALAHWVFFIHRVLFFHAAY